MKTKEKRKFNLVSRKLTRNRKAPRIWLIRMIDQAWSAGHCKETIINRMLMTKDRQWTPHRIEVMDSIRKMQGTPLKEQVMCANGEC
ncbi:hypothetical protein C1S99_03560 [Vibrio parahaemolyticus]|nr:hypothetical protein C1T12_09675 [Vibrio parahaemolyticus]PMS63371.1 hypothetical protein C1S91_09665 [Vibrio parahaemolyticus]PMS69310.1 hypothetical protein C1S96_05855 [Vibrio parahaemolyticus]PMS78329.1 hypothetical protein C1S88_10405 [Vibrio parahaemolyticus]PMS85373.1 hypothetical protein C1S94_11195 [Vibrio parahaemolyticus]